jgi:hypothetical protein
MRLSIGPVRTVDPFDYSWPDYVEHFNTAWQLDVSVPGGLELPVIHGVASRDVYGMTRAHSVTFVSGEPRVEGVGVDDFDRSGLLISRIKKADNKTARSQSELPDDLDGFTIVEHREVIDAPHSPRCLAVAIRWDDAVCWARYAIHRALLHRRI